jgi:hypothetical protein
VTTTYSTQAVPRRPKLTCHDCGASSDVIFVADAVNSADGYLDQLYLCAACLKQREVEKL